MSFFERILNFVGLTPIRLTKINAALTLLGMEGGLNGLFERAGENATAQIESLDATIDRLESLIAGLELDRDKAIEAAEVAFEEAAGPSIDKLDQVVADMELLRNAVRQLS